LISTWDVHMKSDLDNPGVGRKTPLILIRSGSVFISLVSLLVFKAKTETVN
jgi:hypothetical protein